MGLGEHQLINTANKNSNTIPAVFQLLLPPYHIMHFTYNKLYLLWYCCCVAAFSFYANLYQIQRLLKTHRFSVDIRPCSAISGMTSYMLQCLTEEHDKIAQNNSVYLALSSPREKQMHSEYDNLGSFWFHVLILQIHVKERIFIFSYGPENLSKNNYMSLTARNIHGFF